MDVMLPWRALTVFIMAMLSACSIQNSMLYYPDFSVPSEDTLKAEQIAYWPAAGEHWRGFVALTPTAPSGGTVVVFHGNAGNAAHRAFYVKALAPLGYRVILAEYPGYSSRPGALGEKAFVQDGLETVRLAHEQYGGPVYILGESLGCGVAGSVVKATAIKIDGLILITPWDTLAAVAQEKFPFFPVRLLLTDSYDTIKNVKSFAGTIAVVGAERDEIIPLHHATTLYNSLPSAMKRMWIINGAGHNDWFALTTLQWWKDVMSFATGQPMKQ